MPVDIKELLQQMPVIAILRGIHPDEVLEVGRALCDSGIRIIEVPLNSPDPYKSIQRLSDSVGECCLCGAGTVISEAQVERVFEAGGKLIVSPNTDTRVIASTIKRRMLSVPGFSTATEAFTAIEAGATTLKLFPAAAIGTQFLKALSAVIPREIGIVATGGVNAATMHTWLVAGVAGIGAGSDLYQPGISLADLIERAALFGRAYATHINANSSEQQESNKP